MRSANADLISFCNDSSIMWLDRPVIFPFILIRCRTSTVGFRDTAISTGSISSLEHGAYFESG